MCIAHDDRRAYVHSLSLNPGITHLVNRVSVYDDVLKMYRTERERILQEHPFRVQFQGERAIDFGGVAREMFSIFYECVYQNLFDGSALLSPVVNPEMDTSVLNALGVILSHAYIVTGVLPTRMAFPSLAYCLLGSTIAIPESILVEALADSLSAFEAGIVRKALLETSGQVFSFEVMSNLIAILSRFNCRQVPTPEGFFKLLVNIAIYEFLTKPSAALISIHNGVPQQHKSFWQTMGVNGILSLYQAQAMSPAMVLKMSEDNTPLNHTEDRVLGYIRQYIGNTGMDELRSFLQFVTGSSVYSSYKIRVEFSYLYGAGRYPFANTCRPSLTLPCTYTTYPEFVAEFRICLNNSDAWTMDAI